MAVMMRMAARTDIMGTLVLWLRLKRLGWLCTAVMALAVIILFMTLSL